MADEIIPAGDLPKAAPGTLDSVVGVDESTGKARRFPIDALPASPAQATQLQVYVDAAEAARDAAQLSAGVYADTTAGIAATTSGQYFSVPGSDANDYLILYKNNAGSAVEVKRYPSADRVEGLGADVAAMSRRAWPPLGGINVVSGPHLISTWALVANNPVWTVDAAGLHTGAFASATSTPRVWDLGLRWDGVVDAEAETSATFHTLASTNGPCIALGSEETGRVYFLYANNGTISVFDSASAIIAIEGSGLTFTTGEKATLRLRLLRSGDVVATATSPSGTKYVTRFTGITARGMVAPCVRRTDEATISSFIVGPVAYEADIAALGDAIALSGSIADRTFDDYQITSLRVASTGATSTVPTLTVVSGEAVIGSQSISSSPRRWSIGESWNGSSPLLIECETTVDDTTNAVGCAVALGDLPGQVIHFVYLHSGLIGVVTATGAPIAGSGGVQASMAYAVGERARMDAAIYPDGSGYVLATHPSGAQYRQEFTGITARGDVGPSWIRTGSGTIHSLQIRSGLRAIALDLQSRVEGIEAVVDVPTATFTLREWGVLPDASAGRQPRGFTCTGLSRITRGKYKGCWVVGDDGRLVEYDASPFVPKIHIIDPQFRVIVHSFDGTAGSSVQGVAVDTSGTDDTIWVATSSDRHVRHYTVDGVEIAGDAISLANLDGVSYPGSANGLAYDVAADAVFISTTADGVVYKVSCNPAASPRLLATYTLADASPDQLQFILPLLYYTIGGNGSPGTVKSFNVTTSATATAYGPIPLIEAAEGVFIDPAEKVMTIVSDGGFHIAAEPALNLWAQYRIVG